MVLGKLDSNMQKNEPGPLPYTIYKINSKWMKDLNARQEAIKILKEKAGKNLFDLDRSNFLLNMSLEARETKAKMNYWELIKIKSFRGAWVAQSVGHPTSAQVMISQTVSLSPASGSVLIAQSLKPASDSVCLCLSLSLPHSHSVSLKTKH